MKIVAKSCGQFAAAFTFGLALSAPAAAAGPILFNTGLGDEHAQDPNYSLLYEAADTTLVQSQGGLIGSGRPWIDHLSNAKWISPYNPRAQSLDPYETDLNAVFSNPELPGNGSPLGHIYTFRTVVGGSGAGLVEGVFAADNGASISVNGAQTPFFSGGFSSLTPFSIFLTAGDVVDFSVVNWVQSSGNPAGLLVQARSVPEGGTTFGLLAGSFLAVIWLKGRKTGVSGSQSVVYVDPFIPASTANRTEIPANVRIAGE